MDRVTKKQRSKNMSSVKSKNNASTEMRFLNFLKESKISGWRRQYKNIQGIPDFVFLKSKTAIFIDGCFWHGCKKHRTIPETNRDFWEQKIRRNTERDREVTKTLKSKGWLVLRIWEHSLKKTDELKKLLSNIK